MHLAAILLIGLGGEWLWQRLAPVRERSRALVAGLVLVALLLPPMWERWHYYAVNAQWMERTREAIAGDEDVRAILSTLAGLPPGRVYVGRRDNWGKDVKLGYLPLFALLTFHRVVAISPYESFSLNADLFWHFDEGNPAHYDLFDVRYVVAPGGQAMPGFLRPLERSGRYVLYEAPTRGYAEFVALTGTADPPSQATLFARNLDWFLGLDPAAGRFVGYDFPPGRHAAATAADPGAGTRPGCPGGGRVTEERVLPGRLDLLAECPAASTLVVKITYHPNWRVAVDGLDTPTFMVSPSLIGFAVPAGAHRIRAEYRSPALKTALLLLGACALVAVAVLRRRFTRLDAVLASTPSGPGARP